MFHKLGKEYFEKLINVRRCIRFEQYTFPLILKLHPRGLWDLYDSFDFPDIGLCAAVNSVLNNTFGKEVVRLKNIYFVFGQRVGWWPSGTQTTIEVMLDWMLFLLFFFFFGGESLSDWERTDTSIRVIYLFFLLHFNKIKCLSKAQ